MHAWHDVSVCVCIHAEKPATRRNKFNYVTKEYFLAIIIIIINQNSFLPLALHRCVAAVGVSGGDGVSADEPRMILSNSNKIYALWRRVIVVIPAIRSNDHSVFSANSDENSDAVSEKPEEKNVTAIIFKPKTARFLWRNDKLVSTRTVYGRRSGNGNVK